MFHAPLVVLARWSGLCSPFAGKLLLSDINHVDLNGVFPKTSPNTLDSKGRF